MSQDFAGSSQPAAVEAPAPRQPRRSRSISSSTISSMMRPPGASAAMRTTAALKSRKLPAHVASSDAAKARKRSRAGRLIATRVPLASDAAASS
jgi:hypothetical protein